MTFKEETIRSERVYEGRVINLRRDEVMTVSGKPSVREIVEHGGGVALVAVTDEGKIIMERQFRKPLERDVLEIPVSEMVVSVIAVGYPAAVSYTHLDVYKRQGLWCHACQRRL